MLKRLIGNYGRTRISLLMVGILALGTLSPVSYAYATDKKKKDDSGEYYEWELPDKGYSYALNDTKLIKGG